jgi:hypothetical protein
MEEEIFEEVTSDEEAMSVADSVETESEVSEEEIDQEEVATFKDKALKTASSFKDWVVGKVKGMSIADIVMLGTGILLVYQIVDKHAQVAEKGSQKIKLSSAIDGTRATLVNKYNETIHAVAQKTKDNTDLWNKLSPEHQKVIQEEIDMDGDTYWLLNGETLMEKLAEMPIYDPTP